MLKGFDRSVALTAQGVGDNLINVEFVGLGDVEKSVVDVVSQVKVFIILAVAEVRQVGWFVVEMGRIGILKAFGEGGVFEGARGSGLSEGRL